MIENVKAIGRISVLDNTHFAEKKSGK